MFYFFDRVRVRLNRWKSLLRNMSCFGFIAKMFPWRPAGCAMLSCAVRSLIVGAIKSLIDRRDVQKAGKSLHHFSFSQNFLSRCWTGAGCISGFFPTHCQDSPDFSGSLQVFLGNVTGQGPDRNRIRRTTWKTIKNALAKPSSCRWIYWFTARRSLFVLKRKLLSNAKNHKIINTSLDKFWN